MIDARASRDQLHNDEQRASPTVTAQSLSESTRLVLLVLTSLITVSGYQLPFIMLTSYSNCFDVDFCRSYFDVRKKRQLAFDSMHF